MKILVTGFDPFGGEEINPSWQAVKKINLDLEGLEIVRLQLPTAFYRSLDLVKEAIDREEPQVVLSIGQAGGRPDVTPERLAINLDDARIPDNLGQQPLDKKINKIGKNAYFSSLPVKAMVMEIRKAGLPASLSNSAGTYVCNHLMYGVLDYIEEKELDIRAGFIHVPFIPEQVSGKNLGHPSMSLKDIVRSLEVAIEAIVNYKEDPKEVLGLTH